MGTIILVRHGETAANRERRFALTNDLPLTEAGQQQAADCACRIAERFQPAVVITSHYLRARQTAAIIAARFEVEVEVMADLHERDFGKLRGLPYESVLAHPGHEEWTWAPEDGESRATVHRRVNAALQQIRERHPGKHLVVVSHGEAIRALTGRNTVVPANCGVVVLSPFHGDWNFRPDLSTFSTPAPQRWLQQIQLADHCLSVREEMVNSAGHTGTVSVEAVLDGKFYPVTGSPGADSIAYTWVDDRTISGTATKNGDVSLRETLLISPAGHLMTLHYAVFSADKQIASGIAVFERTRLSESSPESH